MYIITVRRITSGELLKQRKGLRIARRYETPSPGSSQFGLMGWTAPTYGIAMCHVGAVSTNQRKEPSEMNVTTIGIDLAKSVFQLHGIDDAGEVIFRKKLRRSGVLDFLRDLPPCLIGLEACATAHFWAREIGALGHDVRLIPPAYVKPYVKRQKNDAADAEAICEAVTRPNMRFVPLKSTERQSVLMLHRTRDLLMRQRTMMLNAVRGHLAEFGIITAQGPHKIQRGYLPCPTLSAHWIRDPGLAAAVETFLEDERASIDGEMRALAAGSPYAKSGPG